MKFRLALVKAVGLGALFVAGISMATNVVVTPGDAQGWFERNSNTGTIGLGIADQTGGTSSLLMSTDGSAGQVLKAARIPLIRINEISSISWDVYADNATWFPALNLEYFNFTTSGTLYYKTDNIALTPNSWTTVTVDFNTDLFTDTRSGETKTLAAWQADPVVGSILMNFFQMGYGQTGPAFAATTTYTDFIELNGITWDFQDVAVLPPQPPIEYSAIPTLSQWAMITMFLLLGLMVFVNRKRLF